MITPQTEYPELAQAVGLDQVRLFLKREDLHPYGSHKGRSIPIMIDIKVAEGARAFALSSSGNAALAAIRHIRHRNAHGDDLSLNILVGKNINPEKKQKLIDEAGHAKVTITESERPLQALFNLIKGIGYGMSGGIGKVVSLRQSTDPDALIGYQSLANEIALVPNLSAVFMPVSSGTSAQAIAESFANNRLPVAVHIVQTKHISPIARIFNSENTNESETDNELKTNDEKSIADAIVDKTAHRKEELVKCIKCTGGHGWIVDDGEIALAQKFIKEKTGIDVSGNGALSLAGLIKAIKAGTKFEGSVVCVVTGK